MLPALAGVAGCGPGTTLWSWQYALGAVRGEMDYLGRAVPIEQGLEDPNLTDEQRAKLAFVIRARDYAEQSIGLNVGSSYRRFVNLNGQVLAWNLSGSRRDAIEAYLWQVPVLGPISYLGFFNHDEAAAERQRLLDAGYDTLLYEVDAFSTLGLLPDPVSSALLDRSYPGLADTVIHELLHNTVWVSRSTVYSESLATFVGRTGALQFIEQEYGAGADLLTQARNSYEDGDRINEFLKEMMAEVQALYAREIPSEEKIAGRETIFEAARQRFTVEVQPTLHSPALYAGYARVPYNNAFLLVNVRYNSDLGIFAEVFEATGRSWPEALAAFRQAGSETDPFAALRTWLDQHAPAAG
jgi:predicted aminopeptidase